jgi:hypothetical protein
MFVSITSKEVDAPEQIAFCPLILAVGHVTVYWRLAVVALAFTQAASIGFTIPFINKFPALLHSLAGMV